MRDPGSPEFRVLSRLSVEQAFAAVRGELEVTAPIELRWFMGRRVSRDFIWTAIVAPKIVSDRVLSVLTSNRFTGWSTYPVAVIGPKGERITGYHGLAVHGRCGRLQDERSVEVVKPGPVGDLITVRRGRYFDESAWDGSDIFVPMGDVAFVFVVCGVYEQLRAAGVKGAAFIRADLNEWG
jgi:hypothetical protein